MVFRMVLCRVVDKEKMVAGIMVEPNVQYTPVQVYI